jgi:prevent-host-death family protein
MFSISVQELKARLSEMLRRASAGEKVLVTRHGRALAVINAADDRSLHTGSNFGTARLRPAFDRPASRGRYLEELANDRSDRR